MSDKVFIKAISYYLPEKTLTNEELAVRFSNWGVSKIMSKVGVSVRHIASENETACDLAARAAEKLFDEYAIDPSSIDFLLLCTQSPDYRLPTSACILQERLGIPTSSGALDYNLGCSGCIYGMAVAKGLIAGGIARNVLLVTAETYSKYIKEDDRSNLSIFGDGAAACCISADGFAKIGNFALGTDGSGAEKLIVRTGGAKSPEKNGKQAVDGDGHIMADDYLYMDGGGIFNFTLKVLPPMIVEILAKNGLKTGDIDYYVFHQANKFMLDAIRKVCALSKEKFYENLKNTGNTISSTVLIGLKDCILNGLIRKSDKVMIAGFGVGLSWGGTVLSFTGDAK